MVQKVSGCDGGEAAGRFFVRAVLVRVGRFARTFICLIMVGLALASPPALAGTTHNVLVLYSYDRQLPANIEGDRGLQARLRRPA